MIASIYTYLLTGQRASTLLWAVVNGWLKEKLVRELIRYIHFTVIAHLQMIHSIEKLKFSIEQYIKMRNEILLQQDINPDKTPFDIREYSKHILNYETIPERGK